MSKTNDKKQELSILGYSPKLLSRIATSKIRSLPNFLIIGAQRSGTTSLYHYLIKHPKIIPAFMKEIHFFDLKYEKGKNWYRAHFPLKTNLKRTDSITGEATPYYLFHPHSAERIKEYMPDIKIIVLMRNPVDRAYSHYNMQKRTGRDKRSFGEAIKEEEEMIEREVKMMKKDSSYISSDYQKYSYLHRGKYVNQLSHWFKHFPKKQFLILKSEDFFDNPERIMNDTLDFLNLEEIKLGEYRKYQKARYNILESKVRKELEKYFEPWNKKLEKLLKREFNW